MYRAIPKDKQPGAVAFRTTLRVPSNIPYVVDNLWEWARPSGYPSRRVSVFASPTPVLAHGAWEKGVYGSREYVAYRVELQGDAVVCQLTGRSGEPGEIDAANHPDCKSLRKLLFRLLGQEWVDAPLSQKSSAGRLFLPCLSKDEVEDILTQEEILRTLCDEIKRSVTYWDHVALIGPDDSLPDPEGEVFFSGKGHFFLKPID